MIYKLLKTLDSLNESEYCKTIYTNSENKPVPRVTDIISSGINEPSLLRWSNSLGFRHLNYEEELQKAADIGTAVHKDIERFLKHHRCRPDQSTIGFSSFLRWWNDLLEKRNDLKVIHSEYQIVGKYFGGTIDCLISINEKLYIVDFKTSNNITYKHFLQLAAYRYLLQVEKSIKVSGVVILQLNKYQPMYREYLLNLEEPHGYDLIEQCERTFLSLVYSYYNKNSVDNKFKHLFQLK